MSDFHVLKFGGNKRNYHLQCHVSSLMQRLHLVAAPTKIIMELKSVHATVSLANGQEPKQVALSFYKVEIQVHTSRLL